VQPEIAMSLPRLAWMLCAVLAACGTAAKWDKPGVTSAALQQDRTQCGEQARLDAVPPYLADAAGTKRELSALTREQQRAQRETDAYQKCMRDKGYSASR
jgi:hypothetical protein